MKKYTHVKNPWTSIILNDGSSYKTKYNLRKDVYLAEIDNINHPLWMQTNPSLYTNNIKSKSKFEF